jgi:hypothetical protein
MAKRVTRTKIPEENGPTVVHVRICANGAKTNGRGKKSKAPLRVVKQHAIPIPKGHHALLFVGAGTIEAGAPVEGPPMILDPSPSSAVCQDFDAKGTVDTPDEQVCGTIDGQSHCVNADSFGNWVIHFAGVPLGPQVLTVVGNGGSTSENLIVVACPGPLAAKRLNSRR